MFNCFEIDLSMVLDYYFSITCRNRISYPEVREIRRWFEKDNHFRVVGSENIFNYKQGTTRCYSKYEDKDKREAGCLINPLHKIRVGEDTFLEDHHLWRITDKNLRKIFLKWVAKCRKELGMEEITEEILKETLENIGRIDERLREEQEDTLDKISTLHKDRRTLRDEVKTITRKLKEIADAKQRA